MILSYEEKKAINNMKLFARVHQDMTIVTANEMNIVLNVIENQQKEIEELKIAFNSCFDECTSLRENFHKQIEISKNKDKKWKDKIKAKIEEEDKLFFKTKDVRHANRYKAYKELLEKE